MFSVKENFLLDGKITFMLLAVSLKTGLTSEKKLKYKEFLQNADKTYQIEYLFKDVLIMLQMFFKN